MQKMFKIRFSQKIFENQVKLQVEFTVTETTENRYFRHKLIFSESVIMWR